MCPASRGNLKKFLSMRSIRQIIIPKNRNWSALKEKDKCNKKKKMSKSKNNYFKWCRKHFQASVGLKMII